VSPLFITGAGRVKPPGRRGAEGWRIGRTKTPLELRKAKRRRANEIAKASRRRNRP